MLFWMILFGLFGLCYFAIAAIVAVRGWSDVKALLRETPPSALPPNEDA